MKFLDALGPGFDITLFHYRNHGADYGRVLAGSTCPRPSAPASTRPSRRWATRDGRDRQPGLSAVSDGDVR